MVHFLKRNLCCLFVGLAVFATSQQTSKQVVGNLTITCPLLKDVSRGSSIIEHEHFSTGLRIKIYEDNLKPDEVITAGSQNFKSSKEFYDTAIAKDYRLPLKWYVAAKKSLSLGEFNVTYGTAEGWYYYHLTYGKIFIRVELLKSLENRNFAWAILKSIQFNSTKESPLGSTEHPQKSVSLPGFRVNLADAPEVKGNKTFGIGAGGENFALIEDEVPDSPTHYQDLMRLARAADPMAKPVKAFGRGFIMLQVQGSNGYTFLSRIGTKSYTILFTSPTIESTIKAIMPTSDVTEEEAMSENFFGPVGGYVAPNRSVKYKDGDTLNIWTPFEFSTGPIPRAYGDVGEAVTSDDEQQKFYLSVSSTDSQFSNQAEGEKSLFDPKSKFPFASTEAGVNAPSISYGFRWIKFGKDGLLLHVRSVSRFDGRSQSSGHMIVSDVVYIAGPNPKVVRIRGNRSATHGQRAENVLRSLTLSSKNGADDVLFSSKSYQQPFQWMVGNTGVLLPVSDIPAKGYTSNGTTRRYVSITSRGSFAITPLGLKEIEAEDDREGGGKMVDRAKKSFFKESAIEGFGSAKMPNGREIGYAYGENSLIIQISGGDGYAVQFLFPDKSKIPIYIEQYLLKDAKNIKRSQENQSNANSGG